MMKQEARVRITLAGLTLLLISGIHHVQGNLFVFYVIYTFFPSYTFHVRTIFSTHFIITGSLLRTRLLFTMVLFSRKLSKQASIAHVSFYSCSWVSRTLGIFRMFYGLQEGREKYVKLYSR